MRFFAIYACHSKLCIDFCDSRVSKCESSQEDIPKASETEQVLCSLDDTYLIKTELAIATDGSARIFANAIEREDKKYNNLVKKINSVMHPMKRPFKVVRYIDDNQRVYKSIPIKLPKHWRHDLNYSVRTKGSQMNLDALPADDKGNYCAILLFKANDLLAVENCDSNQLRDRIDEYMPQFSRLIDDPTMEKIALKPPSRLPSFRYVTPRLNQGKGTVLLGDCAHTVKPYFGLGANSALEDVSVSDDISFIIKLLVCDLAEL